MPEHFTECRDDWTEKRAPSRDAIVEPLNVSPESIFAETGRTMSPCPRPCAFSGLEPAILKALEMLGTMT